VSTCVRFQVLESIDCNGSPRAQRRSTRRVMLSFQMRGYLTEVGEGQLLSVCLLPLRSNQLEHSAFSSSAPDCIVFSSCLVSALIPGQFLNFRLGIQRRSCRGAGRAQFSHGGRRQGQVGGPRAQIPARSRPEPRFVCLPSFQLHCRQNARY
jgi:hypothetical protein